MRSIKIMTFFKGYSAINGVSHSKVNEVKAGGISINPKKAVKYLSTETSENPSSPISFKLRTLRLGKMSRDRARD